MINIFSFCWLVIVHLLVTNNHSNNIKKNIVRHDTNNNNKYFAFVVVEAFSLLPSSSRVMILHHQQQKRIQTTTTTTISNFRIQQQQQQQTSSSTTNLFLYPTTSRNLSTSNQKSLFVVRCSSNECSKNSFLSTNPKYTNTNQITSTTSRKVSSTTTSTSTQLYLSKLVDNNNSSLDNNNNNNNNNSNKNDPYFNSRTTIALVGGQSILILAAILIAYIIGTPNYGFGPGVIWSRDTILIGTGLALPLGILAYALDGLEQKYTALQDVTKATQRSVLTLMGGTFKPIIAFVIALSLGIAAGFGEEILFRGIFQYEISERFGPFIGITISSIIFGLLHAVTPIYAVLATIASFYFGLLYISTDNLAIPIVCHTIYDICALYYAHYTVSQLSCQEMEDLMSWEGPRSK